MKENTEIRLAKAMSRLAAEVSDAAPPRELESMLLRQFDRAVLWRRRRMLLFATGAGAIAASLATLWIVTSRPAPPLPPQVVAAPVPEAPKIVARPKRERTVRQQAAAAPEMPFVPIPYVTPLDRYERFDIVRMELPVAALIAAGFEIQSPDTGALAEADVVVGQDGRARAVRLISISNLN